MAAPVYAQQPVQMTQVEFHVPKNPKVSVLGSEKNKMSQIDVDTHLLIYEYVSTDQLISA